MSAIASHIISILIVCSTVSPGADQRKHQSSASLSFVRGIHRWPLNSPHKELVTRKMFHLMSSCDFNIHCVAMPIKLHGWNVNIHIFILTKHVSTYMWFYVWYIIHIPMPMFWDPKWGKRFHIMTSSDVVFVLCSSKFELNYDGNIAN